MTFAERPHQHQISKQAEKKTAIFHRSRRLYHHISMSVALLPSANRLVIDVPGGRTIRVDMSPRMQDSLGRKAGRFDPSEPLHMTTRHAAKKGRPNGTPSVNGSAEDNDSRRDSLEGIRPTTAHSLGSHSSPKGRRISGESANSTLDVNMSFTSHRSASKNASKDFSNHTRSQFQQVDSRPSQSPSRKRKRTYTPPSITRGAATVPTPAIPLQGTGEDLRIYKDVVVVVPEDQISDQESGDSSSGQDVGGYLAATQSTEITPAATPLDSEPVSPVSEETNPTPRYPEKHSDSVMLDADNPAEEEDMDDMDEDDVANAGEDVDDLADVDDDEDHPTTGPRRRMTGRRRADHHEIDIEATMRRQAQLKSAYRAIARALKPLLAEIASKTVDDLEANPALHQEVSEYDGTEEYEGVRKLLDQALEDRKRQLDAQLEYNREQIWKRFQGEKFARSATFGHEFDNMRDKCVDEAELELLQLARYIQLEQSREQEVTDDEDGEVLLRPKQTGYRFERTGTLDPRHESRSRLALDTQKAIADMQQRFEMHQMLQDAMHYDDSKETASFTVMDSAAREAAHAKRESIRSTNVLADAAAEVDRILNIPIIPNEEAVGLQLLGDLASRPSVRAVVPPSATTRRLDHPFVPLNEQNPMPPPSALPGPPAFVMRHQPTPQMSPGTAQFIERSMPYSPQRYTEMDAHSERLSWEPSLMSPVSRSENRLSTFPALASLLQSPSLNLPGRRDSVPRRHHRHASHESQHQRQSSHDAAQNQRWTTGGSIGGLLSDLDRSESSLPGAQGKDDASWDRYHRPMSREVDGQQFVRSERTIHEFSKRGPLSIERLAPPPEAERREETAIETATRGEGQRQPKPDDVSEPRVESEPGVEADAESQWREEEEEEEEEVQGVKSASPSLSRQPALRDRSPEQPSSEGAIDPRLLKEDEARVSMAPRAVSEDTQMRKPRSRASSLGHSTTTDVSGSQDGDRGLRRQTKDGTLHHGKTNRAERNGLSRKAHKETKRTQNKRASNAMRAGTEGGSKMFRFRLNTMESTKPNPFSSRTPTGTPQTSHNTLETPYAPLPSYVQQQPPSGFPAPYGPPPPHQYHPDPYYHRNSLPGPWPHPSYGPGYPYPQGPPPLGHRPDNWPAGAPPPPPSNASQPPAPPGPSSFGSQYGGPAIAPATSDSRYPFGTGPPGGNHLPAFAQQQRNSDSGSSRRRTQSDAPRQTKFHHYAGPRNR
ncbi:hypothetical protein CERZMDRAFT_96777 [Cercospora zeae-maydis SCOH1-5]|uniref:Uncharacterized protein n=1 Tax=Cercospora zeae-maydis SCOH1-5 TaxID=717836 RepID=A0A6A6FI24_9PEZI|nr:hypothetical protein CERZMDRAFT_96777 [Cercospora zeae-maydis SCOH1-5]